MPAASCAVLNEVSVFPEPVVCQMYPPASSVPSFFRSYSETRMRLRMFSHAQIWYGRMTRSVSVTSRTQ